MARYSGSGFAFVLLYYLIHAIGPTRTTMVTYVFPLGGVLLGVGFLGRAADLAADRSARSSSS